MTKYSTKLEEKLRELINSGVDDVISSIIEMLTDDSVCCISTTEYNELQRKASLYDGIRAVVLGMEEVNMTPTKEVATEPLTARQSAIKKLYTTTGISEMTLTGYFDYLDEYYVSQPGKTNMFECIAGLMDKNPNLSRKDAAMITLEWRDSCGK